MSVDCWIPKQFQIEDVVASVLKNIIIFLSSLV